MKAGADTKKVFVIDDSKDALSLTDTRIEEAINKKNAKLLIIDPIQAYLGAGIDMHRANEIRPIMHDLSNVAERTGCSILLIGHMNKDEKRSNPLNKSLGSVDIVASARSVLFLGRDPKNDYIRAVVPIKSSLAPEGKGVAFELNPDEGFKWIGESELTATEMLKDKKKTSKLKEAKKYILDLLEDGDILVKEAEEILKDEDFSPATIRRAREQLTKELKLESYSTGYGKEKKGYWKKSETDDKI